MADVYGYGKTKSMSRGDFLRRKSMTISTDFNIYRNTNVLANIVIYEDKYGLGFEVFWHKMAYELSRLLLYWL